MFPKEVSRWPPSTARRSIGFLKCALIHVFFHFWRDFAVVEEGPVTELVLSREETMEVLFAMADDGRIRDISTDLLLGRVRPELSKRRIVPWIIGIFSKAGQASMELFVEGID